MASTVEEAGMSQVPGTGGAATTAAGRVSGAGTRPRLKPAARRLVLTVHIVSSIGWIGVYLVMLTLVITGLTASDPGVVRAAYVIMQVIDANLTVPLTLTMLVSGVVLSLGTKWGLTRYYWVLVKLAITAGLTVLVLTRQKGRLASAAAAVSAVDSGLPANPGNAAIMPPIVAITAALVATVLSVYKPWGRTRWASKKRLTGATVTGPRLTGPQLDVPQLNGPQLNGPQSDVSRSDAPQFKGGRQ